MPQEHLPDCNTDTDLEPELFKQIGDVLQRLRDRLAAERMPGQRFALIHLVEGLSIDEWMKIAGDINIANWLALPLDQDEEFPLMSLRDTMEKLTFQRDHDSLTGLANRRFFDRTLQFELQRAYRTASPLSIVMIDIDHFKKVNDRFGHATGDTVLQALSRCLMDSLRIYDLAARVGGEEFCIILPGATTFQAVNLTKRILENFSALVFESPGKELFSVTFSAGVATATAFSEINAAELLAQADAHLYDAKNTGRNRVVSKTTKQRLVENPALVQPAEKLFLFTGKAQ